MIPVPVIAVVADILADFYTHSELDVLFESAGSPGEPPSGNKVDKTRAWLKRISNDISESLEMLGKILEEYMEVDNRWSIENGVQSAGRQKIETMLRRHGLAYVRGGHIAQSGVVTVSKSLQQIIQSHDLTGLQTEFERILKNVESDPASAITAACGLLESLFQVYITENQLEMPSDTSIKPLWNVVRKHLNIDAAAIQDEDLRKIVSGLGSIVDGIAALRTHKGSAHGHGYKQYKLEPRHARLAAHAAVTLATFIFEVWTEKKTQS